MMYGWHYQGMGGGSWALMIIGMLVFWAILVIGLVALIRHNSSGHDSVASSNASSSAISILKERFARGEINEEDYTHRLAILKDQS
jgi:putative membrane protein